MTKDQLIKAMELERQRTAAINTAMAQQQMDLQRLALMQQQSSQNVLVQYGYGVCTSSSMCTSGASYADSTTQSFGSGFAGLAACGVDTATSERREAQQVIRKSFVQAETRSSSKSSSKSEDTLTWETSPMFGRPAFGRFYNWQFGPLFPSVRKRLMRWAWNKRRSMQ